MRWARPTIQNTLFVSTATSHSLEEYHSLSMKNNPIAKPTLMNSSVLAASTANNLSQINACLQQGTSTILSTLPALVVARIWLANLIKRKMVTFTAICAKRTGSSVSHLHLNLVENANDPSLVNTLRFMDRRCTQNIFVVRNVVANLGVEIAESTKELYIVQTATTNSCETFVLLATNQFWGDL